MRYPYILLVVVAALTLSACQTPGSAPGAFAPSASVSGALVHRDSGFSFPAQVGRFQRVSPLQYDPAGRDVSVGYNSGFPQIIATIYVYPTGNRTLEQEFVRRQAEVTSFRPGVQLLSRATTTVTPARVRALSAEYAFTGPFAGSVQPLRSVLLVAQRGERFVEYRFSYPAPTQNIASPLVRQLAQTYAWP